MSYVFFSKQLSRQNKYVYGVPVLPLTQANKLHMKFREM